MAWASNQSAQEVITLPAPICKHCGLPMDWKRTRRSFSKAGVVNVTVFACEQCEEVVQVEGL